jgi:pyruvate dehydrogenase E2 component (dihydrolipoamide acetyltransferase)
MPTPVLLPKLGNTVESAILVTWKTRVGESVRAGDVLAEVETDKALMQVAAPADGVILALHAQPGDVVPVQTEIATLGAAGEIMSARPPVQTSDQNLNNSIDQDRVALRISPRARTLAAKNGVALTGISGSGPDGRIIERDIQAAISARPPLTVSAKAHANGQPVPAQGTGIGGRITTNDLKNIPETAPAPVENAAVIPLRGVRKIIAERMLASLQTTAQLTLNMPADARALQAYRKRLKASDPALGLNDVALNDLILYAVARTLPHFPELNTTLIDKALYRHSVVHLGFAVDTPRGLLVPVIRDADKRGLRDLSQEAKRLIAGAQAGTLPPDALNGGTFTVSNLGSFGVETFTPVLNPPQVGILGVGAIHLKPVEVDEAVQFIPHIHLSLTIDHQAVDGAPGARFLQALAKNMAAFDLLLAM